MTVYSFQKNPVNRCKWLSLWCNSITQDLGCICDSHIIITQYPALLNVDSVCPVVAEKRKIVDFEDVHIYFSWIRWDNENILYFNGCFVINIRGKCREDSSVSVTKLSPLLSLLSDVWSSTTRLQERFSLDFDSDSMSSLKPETGSREPTVKRRTNRYRNCRITDEMLVD